MITSAIEIMVRKGHIKILSDPLVKTLITTKWDRFASTQFLLHAFLYLAFVIAQTFLVWLHSSAGQWNGNSREVGPGLHLHLFLLRAIPFDTLFFLLCVYQCVDGAPASAPSFHVRHWRLCASFSPASSCCWSCWTCTRGQCRCTTGGT